METKAPLTSVTIKRNSYELFEVSDGDCTVEFATFAEARAFVPVAQTHGVSLAYYGPEDYSYEDEDGSRDYAEMLERRAEFGTWFGRDEWDN